MFLKVKSLCFQTKQTIAMFYYSVYRTNSGSKRGKNKIAMQGRENPNTVHT